MPRVHLYRIPPGGTFDGAPPPAVRLASADDLLAFATSSVPDARFLDPIRHRLLVALPADGDPAVAGWLRGLGPGDDHTPPVRADPPPVELLEAPGVVGEARMVARRVRELLADGVSPDRIAVTARDVAATADVFA